MTRRQTLLHVAALPLMAEKALTQQNRFPRMVHEYFVAKVSGTGRFRLPYSELLDTL